MSADLPVVISFSPKENCVLSLFCFHRTILVLTCILLLFHKYLSHAADQGPHLHNTHLWMLSEKGIQIFTPGGARIVKSIPPKKVCKESKNSDGLTCVRCNFFDVVSDGKKVRPFFVPSAPFALYSLTLLTLVINTQ